MVDIDKATKGSIETVKSYLQTEGLESSRSTKVWRMICLIAQLIVGCTFVFSSLMKGIDPTGTAIKIGEYASSFGVPLSDDLSSFFAIFLNVLEGLLGIALLLGLVPRLTSGILLVLMSGMTLLTLYIVIYNPVKDCGCFGDALKISNTATFLKNLILLPLTILLWIKRSRWVRLLDESWDVTLIIVSMLLLINFNMYPVKHLPAIDFRPYKVGSNLKELTLTGGSEGEYEYLFVYEKEGKEKTFSLEELSNIDDSWTYVRDETRVIKEAQQPAGSDFVLLREDGSNAMEQIAYEKGRALLLITPDFNKISRKLLNRILEFQKRSDEKLYLAVSNGGEIWESEKNKPFEHEFKEILFLDKTTAKTVIRSNPGLLVIKEGKIVRKLSAKDFDKLMKKDSFVKNPYQPVEKYSKFKSYFYSFGPLAVYAIILVILGWIHGNQRRKLRRSTFTRE